MPQNKDTHSNHSWTKEIQVRLVHKTIKIKTGLAAASYNNSELDRRTHGEKHIISNLNTDRKAAAFLNTRTEKESKQEYVNPGLKSCWNSFQDHKTFLAVEPSSLVFRDSRTEFRTSLIITTYRVNEHVILLLLFWKLGVYVVNCHTNPGV